MSPIDVQKDIKKNTWSKAKYIREKLPCFVSTGYLLRRVTGLSIKRPWKVWFRISNSFPVNLPNFTFEHSPIPGISTISWIAIKSPAPKSNEKLCEIERNKVHKIGRETAGNGKVPIGGETTEQTWLRYAYLLTS
jgi:hypothetical protein